MFSDMSTYLNKNMSLNIWILFFYTQLQKKNVSPSDKNVLKASSATLVLFWCFGPSEPLAC